jgi:hypothetical protein
MPHARPRPLCVVARSGLFQIDAVDLDGFIDDEIDYALVEILAAQECVAAGRKYPNCFSPSTFAMSIIDTSKVPPPRS